MASNNGKPKTKILVQCRDADAEGIGYSYKARVIAVNSQTGIPEIVAEMDIWVNDKRNLKGVVGALAKQIYEKSSNVTSVGEASLN